MADSTSECETILEQLDCLAGDREAQMGDGVQRY